MPQQQQSRFATPDKACDIVLKGGITSGVVYPLALTALAEQYRFSNIGGTSAGAIAAAAAAAAEYGRYTENAGFTRLERIPTEVGSGLLAMFQPAPALKPLFNMFVAALKAKSSIARVVALIRSAICGYLPGAIVGLLPGGIAVVTAIALNAGAGFIAFGVLLALVGMVAGIIWLLLKTANKDLIAHDFGLCPGIRQPCQSAEGFTDWLARLIEEAAGHTQAGCPLTFGDLAAPPGGRPPIQLAMITTSLMEQRPYTLPFSDHRFYFEKSEWDRIFPEAVMKFLTLPDYRLDPPPAEGGEYYRFPDPERLPLIVAARMSLSFPFLICGVPLWCHDRTLRDDTERNKLRRCLFSDGGLSSNFPIHFFDALLPNTPTFAITLDEYDAKRNYSDVWLPENAHSGMQLPIQSFDGIGGFLMRLLTSAKDWQDNLQSTLTGYRERIVHVVLKPDEGGLNLTMDEKTIEKIVGYGKKAGEALRDQFDLDAHRWRRFLVAMARMEETLDDVAKAYQGVPGGPETFADFLARYSGSPDSYKQDAATLAAMLKRGAELAAEGADWRVPPIIRSGQIPRPATNLRITPKF